jgi:hypothetical protein
MDRQMSIQSAIDSFDALYQESILVQDQIATGELEYNSEITERFESLFREWLQKNESLGTENEELQRRRMMVHLNLK